MRATKRRWSITKSLSSDAPVIFFLILYYRFSVIPKTDRILYPSTFATWFSWISLAIFTGLSGILILARVFGLALFR